MLYFYILLSVALLITVSTVINIYERRFKQDLLETVSFERFRKLKVTRLELKRYVKNTQFGSNIRMPSGASKRREISIDSDFEVRTGIFNTLEDELTVYAYVNDMEHEAYTCPYSEENKSRRKETVEKYNKSVIS